MNENNFIIIASLCLSCNNTLILFIILVFALEQLWIYRWIQDL